MNGDTEPPIGYVAPSLACCVEYVDALQPGEGAFQVAAFTTLAMAEAFLERLEAEGFFAPLRINIVPVHERIEDWDWDR